MDGYVSKPVNKAEIVAILKRYIPAWGAFREEPAGVTQGPQSHRSSN
jgi:hypothetical protein